MLQMQVNEGVKQEVKHDAAVVMADERVRRNLVLWVGYFGVILILKLLRRGYRVFLSLDWVMFLVGGFLGMFVWLADKLVYVYYTRPNDELSLKIKQMVKAKQYKEVLKILWGGSHKGAHLAMNNVLFLGVWVALGFFLVTSSPSWFGRGIVLGIGLELVRGIKDDWEDQEGLMGRLFWPVMRRVSPQEMKLVIGVFLGAFGLISLMAV